MRTEVVEHHVARNAADHLGLPRGPIKAHEGVVELNGAGQQGCQLNTPS